MYPSPIESSSPKVVYFNHQGHNSMPIYMERPFQNRFQQQFQPQPSPKTSHKITNKEDVPETKVTASPSSPNSVQDEMTQKTVQAMFEKKRKRRESHNAVERRRRENINDRINELATLLPEGPEGVKTNKGTILRKSVESIRHLHGRLRQYQERIRDLEHTLEAYRQQIASSPNILLPSGPMNYHPSSMNKQL
ncbi:Myc-type, basic helix-loop-helix domain-containing protein [Sporodiniella umbellata]|nr:Myc-type, basic helix-loop-helix domain-containing protein [Sporodiniella umbellata]